MALRISGLNSGLDTESIITELVKAKSAKVDTLKKEQTKLGWTQTAWQDLNKKVYSLYSGTLSKLRFSDAYDQKTTTVSDSTKASIVTSGSAVTGTQTLSINQMARAGYLTGGQLSTTKAYSSSSKISAIDADMVGKSMSVNGTEIAITADSTVQSVTTAMRNAGVNASFDATNQRFFISAKETGASNDFTLTGDAEVLAGLGLDYASNLDVDGNVISGTGAVRITGQDCSVTLNGATFTSSSNTVSVNGLTITATGLTEASAPLSLSTTTDYSGIYDTIKDFLKEYNELVNEISKLYNADKSKLEPLTEEEKSAMSDSEVEKWEDAIKASLLRGDDTLSTLRSSMSSIVSGGFTVGSKTVYLSDYGIGTAGYFDADADERYALHIDGDSDDESSATNEDKFMAAISEDPTAVASFFTQLSNALYTELNKQMGTTEYSSIYKVYDDKKMKSDYSDYETKILKAQEKLSEMEDRWYQKFTAMEVALSKMQSNESTLSNLFGS